MRLLLTDTSKGQLTFYMVPNPEDPPQYAILSHTWIEGQEVSFQDAQSNDSSIRAKSGYRKILRCCRRANRAGYDYVWIDTCCIDKTSSAELSEAINSMYAWYRYADICLVCLEKVHSSSLEDAEKEGSEFRECRWFTRGWTLQELIAPRRVDFYTVDWKRIGDKNALAETINSITGVHHAILRSEISIRIVSIATKMSWGANRKTTRVEDKAYALLGLFGVNMPTIYGEGERAFTRLQHEIMAVSPGHSLFAWNIDNGRSNAGVLADSPDRFSKSVDIVDVRPHVFANTWGLQDGAADPHRTSRGIQLTLPVFKMPEIKYAHPDRTIDAIAVIACTLVDSAHARRYSLGLALRYADQGVNNVYVRMHHHCFIRVQCLLDMGVPWTVQPLVLIDDVNKMINPDSTLARELTEVDITIEAHTLRTLCRRSAFKYIKYSSHHSHPGPNMDNVTLPQLFEGCHDVAYDQTKNITIKWDGKSEGRLFFAQSTQSLDSVEFSRILRVLTFPTSFNTMRLGIACLHHSMEASTSLDNISVEATKSLNFNEYGDECQRLQCHCGLVADISLAPLRSSSHMEIASYMLEIEVAGGEDVPKQSLACRTRRPTAPLEVPPELRSQQTLRWVECTAGFTPQDAIPWTDEICVARIPQKHIGSGLDSRLDSTCKVRASSMAVIVNTPNRTCHTLSYNKKYASMQSLGYEMLAGPTKLVFWVRCVGTFELQALGGATPVDIGYDADDAKLYFARFEIDRWASPTIVKVGSPPLDDDENNCDPYEVLCMRVDKASSLYESNTNTHSDTIILRQSTSRFSTTEISLLA